MDNLVEAIEAIRPAVIQIGPAGTSREVFGTGFLVSLTGHAITASHVIDAVRLATATLPEAAIAGLLNVGLAIPNTEHVKRNFALVPATIIDEDRAHDLVLLKLTVNPFAGEIVNPLRLGGPATPLGVAVARFNDERPKEGTRIAASGYPFSVPALVTTTGVVASAWFDGSILARPSFLPQRQVRGADAYLMDVQANPGNSGGPVYRVEDGRVVGVCILSLQASVTAVEGAASVSVAGLTTNSGLTVVTPATYVVDMLKRNGIEPAD